MINLQKHYDKLTARERFAALTAAVIRNDEQERKALLQSAPRKVFSYPNTQGLYDAFFFLSMWHVMNQLGYAASLYFMLEMIWDESETIQIGDVIINFDDAFILVQRRILEGCEAWRVICKEYGQDPNFWLDTLPFVETLETMELITRAANKDNPLELTDLQETINGYRKAIETKSAGWE